MSARDSTSPACRRSVALQVAEPCRLKALSVLHCHSMSPVEARYENGLLKPAKPLHLRPGEMVGLIVVRRPDPSRWNFTRLARGAAEDESFASTGLDAWADELEGEDRR